MFQQSNLQLDIGRHGIAGEVVFVTELSGHIVGDEKFPEQVGGIAAVGMDEHAEIIVGEHAKMHHAIHHAIRPGVGGIQEQTADPTRIEHLWRTMYNGSRFPGGSMLNAAISSFLSHGYSYIGMDHFAKPSDELTISQREKKLQRNFQGYSTRAGSDIYAFGMSAVSQTPDVYWQNEKELPKWQAAVDGGKVPLHKAYILSEEDKLRRATIMRTMCDLSLYFDPISQRFGINFEQHFAKELAALAPFEADGLVRRTAKGFDVTDAGRLFIRNIAMTFDNTLAPVGERRHSKTI